MRTSSGTSTIVSAVRLPPTRDWATMLCAVGSGALIVVRNSSPAATVLPLALLANRACGLPSGWPGRRRRISGRTSVPYPFHENAASPLSVTAIETGLAGRAGSVM